MLKKFIAKEKDHFNRLNTFGQQLIISIIFYSLLAPIFYVFINAFLWRQSGDFKIVAVYNIFFFIGILVGFFINGLLYKLYSPSRLYIIGVFFQGISTAILLLLPAVNYWVIIIFGIIFGVATGIYWANRNFLTLKATESHNRIYFASIESNADTLLKIIIPALIGWFIIGFHFADPLAAYKYLAFFMLLVSLIIGWKFKNFDLKIPKPSNLFLKSTSARWMRYRVFQLLDGFMDGVMAFAPTLMVLYLVGQEDTLGSIQSISALIAAVVIFFLGKSLTIKHRTRLLLVNAFMAILGTAFFSLNYSELGVYVLFACEAVSIPLFWLADSSLSFDLIDENENKESHYAYVVDREVYLNLGRIGGVLIFLLWAQVASSSQALRFTPLLFALFQIPIALISHSMDTKLNSE